MAIIDFAHRQITAKIVYVGPHGAGTNTNVLKLHELIPSESKSRLHHFGPDDEEERSLYFDYVPGGVGLITGFSTRFRVYTLPGGIAHRVHRREVCKGTDAIVFVADARKDRAQDNIQSMIRLEKSLSDQGLELAALPAVLQVNRTDADDARESQEVAYDLNPYGFPVVEGVARAAKGVLETHEHVVRITVARIHDNLAGDQTAMSLTAVQRASLEQGDDVIRRHIQALRDASTEELEAHTAEEDPSHVMLDTQYMDLPVGPVVELGFQPRDLVDARPVRILRCRLEGDRIQLDILLATGPEDTPQRLRLVLANRPVTPQPVTSSITPVAPHVGVSLPERVELTPTQPSIDFPPVWYGVAGLAGGLLTGVLLGFILFG